MSSSLTKIVLLFVIIYSALSQYVTWGEIPSLRVGQVQSVQSLMTSEDINPNITDQAVTFLNPITGAATSDLKTGVSLMSYESWMTDTFSYNITVTYFDATGLTIRFRVLGNTFFSSAKVHYIVLWRTNSPDNGPAKTYNLQVLFGCYLTADLLAGVNTRNTTVGNLTTSIPNNSTYVVLKSMIAGLQMSNSVGVNNYIQVKTAYSIGSNLIKHTVIVENNCFLQFVCLTTLIHDQKVSSDFDINIIQFSTTVLTATSVGLTTVPYMARYDGVSRMFFGFSKLNLSMSDTRYLNVETANISLVSLLYDKNQAMNQVNYNMFFFAKRACPNTTYQVYNPDTYDCNTTCPTEGYKETGTAPNKFCMPCHYSCLTCSTGNSPTACTKCDTNKSRVQPPASGVCDCATTFSDSGVAQCVACNSSLNGCLTCSSPNYCTNCIDNVIYTRNATSGKCECAVTTYMASGYCLPYPGCLNATKFNNNISCDVCDTANYFVMQNNSTCLCQLGFQLNMSANPVVCYHNCSNGIAPAVDGLCDDNNTTPDDGCTNCTRDDGYHCTFTMLNATTPAPSNCTLKTVVTITYLYAQRLVNSNHFIMAFSLSPTVSTMSADIFAKNFVTTIPISSSSITYDSSSQTIYLEGDYTQSIEGTVQTANITFNDMSFYADPMSVSFTCIGANAELVIETYNSTNKMLQYIIMGMGVYALLLAIFSAVVGLKMVGIELLVPVQLIYFSLATMPNQSTYSFILNNLKYANGYSTIETYNYYRTASQSRNLVGMNYQTEFLLSINVMLLLYILILLWLMVHHFRLKYKEHKLQKFLQEHAPVEDENRSNDSEEDKQNQDRDQEKVKLTNRKRQNNELQQQESKLREDHHRSFKVFSFEVDRVYFIFYLILLNQMMFGFIIMTLNVPITIFTYPQQINVLVCNFIFFIYIGNIVFISYDQQSNKMINFTSISDRYAYVYFVIDFIIIIVLSMTFQLDFSLYLVCVLSSAFLLLIIKERPYSSVLCTYENVVAMYLHAMLLISLILLCMMSSKSSNERQDLIYSYMIIAMIFIGQILTTIRVVIKVNFKKAFDDLKDPNDDDNLDKKAKKVIEKDLDLLQRENRMEIIPPDSVRNGLLTPKDKMVDWESKNTDEYESLKRENQNHETKQGPDADNSNTGQLHEEEGSEIKNENLNQLQLLKKKLRNNLKLKQEASALSKKDK